MAQVFDKEKRITAEAKRLPETCHLISRSGLLLGHDGDWLVTYPDGFVRIYSDSEYHQRFGDDLKVPKSAKKKRK